MIVRSSMTSALNRVGLDRDLTRILVKSLVDDDVKILEGATVDEFEAPNDDGALRIRLKSGDLLEVDCFLAATGRVPNTTGNDALGLQAAGVELGKKGHIEVNDALETSQKGIFAAGDTIAGPALASTGVEQAQRAVANAFGDVVERGIDNFPVGVRGPARKSLGGMPRRRRGGVGRPVARRRREAWHVHSRLARRRRGVWDVYSRLAATPRGVASHGDAAGVWRVPSRLAATPRGVRPTAPRGDARSIRYVLRSS